MMFEGQNNENPFNFKKTWIMILAVLAVIITAVVLFFYYKNFKEDRADLIDINIDNDTLVEKEIGKLPGEETEGNIQDENLRENSEELKAERLTFGSYYKKISDNMGLKESFELPINVKKDVSNYYDITRVINLDKQVEYLNKNGFSYAASPYPDKMNNFYNSYGYLLKNRIPILVTGDFLIYYYQDSLKNIFNDIKSNIFYDEVWDVNKKMFDIAYRRYEDRKKITGNINDPIMEGERLEAAYFAVALELLKPKKEQINLNDIIDEKKFTQTEAGMYSQSIPEDLEKFVTKELEFIQKASKVERSPVFLYEKDYSVFKVPSSLSNNRLINFYLASRWMNSVFPLYYQNDKCPDCLLDKDDWIVNMAASVLITGDFSNNQEIKNEWAKIYKVVAYFEGIKRELSYLDYYDSLPGAYGENYKFEEILSSDREILEKNLIKLQTELAKRDFKEIEGGSSAVDIGSRKQKGMRLLQESGTPNDYIFSKLTRPNVTFYAGGKKIADTDGINKTACKINMDILRCGSIGLDVVNLIYPIKSNPYFSENSNYENYLLRANELKNEISTFNDFDWHSSGFWSNISIGRTILYPEEGMSYLISEAWQKKNIGTFMGSWVNLQLPEENKINSRQIGSALSSEYEINDYDYIEPNLSLLNELAAEAKMVRETLFSLQVVKEKDPALNKLDELYSQIEKMRNIVKKEINGEELSVDNKRDIVNLVAQYAINGADKKSVKISFKNDNKINIVENIQGIQIMALVYELNGKRIIAIGPIFNYIEK